MLKVVIYEKENVKKARAVLDFGYRTLVISWDTNVCAEILKVSVLDLLQLENGTYKVLCSHCGE